MICISLFVTFRRRTLAAAILLAFALHSPAARADDAATMAQLRAIVDLSYSANPAATRRLESLRAGLPPNVSYKVQRELLLTRQALQRDAGRADDAYETLEALRELAQANRDQPTVMMARLGLIDRLIDKNKPMQALAALDSLRPQIGAKPGIELLNWLDLAYADVYNNITQYDKALSRYLAVLERSEGSGELSLRSRLQTIMLISRLYVNMNNPEKGLAMATSALATYRGTIAPRPLAWLTFVQGLAYVALERNAEGLAAFESALAIAERAGLAGMEGTILGNIADHYLHAHEYTKAEGAARRALEKSQQVNDTSSMLMARANLGFALGGQGKLDAALPYIREVIAALRTADSSGDLVNMLDETSRMFEAAGRAREALAFVREQQTVQKGMLAAERDQAVAALQEKFEADRRQRQIDLLARDNQLKDTVISNKRQEQLLVAVTAMLLLAAGGFIYLQYRRATRANAALEGVNAQLEFHATRDPLTGLFNRRVFLERMQRRADIPEAERRSQRGGCIDAITIIDIDHFKSINDRWGHAVGDRVLVEVARRLTEAVRASDVVLRWGGEEFLVFAPGIPAEQIDAMVERLLSSVSATPVDCGDVQVPVRISAGTVPLPLCDFPETQFSWEKALQLADRALYHAKTHGRNRAVVVTGLREPARASLAQAEADFTAAVGSGVVAVAGVAGPV